jgi:predicted RNA polymerase sigma factor
VRPGRLCPRPDHLGHRRHPGETGGLADHGGAAARHRSGAPRLGTRERTLPLLVEPVGTEPGAVEVAEIIDDRLRLMFTCCHPAIGTDAQVALTLRLLCGLTTAEVARAFLVSESTMAARITRAKKKIAMARIPYRVPPVTELPPDRCRPHVVHVLYSTGHTAPAGADLIRRDLVERSFDLARVLRTLLPDDADVAGLLALILLTDARRPSRLGDDGRLVLLPIRIAPDGTAGHRGGGCARARGAGAPTPGSLRPHGRHRRRARQAPSWEATDWTEIVGIYDLLVAIWPSPGRRPQPRRRRRPGAGPRGRDSSRSTRWATNRSWRRTAILPPHALISSGSWGGAGTRVWRTKRRCF